ncbi:MAG: choice-of-anchor B family protein, partial [Planctomycetota bacterium]
MKRRGSYLVGFLLLFLIAPAAQAQSGFGRAVAVGGGEILVGEAANQATSGMVYVYRRSGGEWREATQLVSSETAARDRFGRAIALDGNTLLVAGTTQEGESGVVFVFEKTGAGNWTEVGKLNSREADPTFGSAVAVSNDAALVGAPGQNTVHAFRRRANGQWYQQGSLTVADGAEGERFGGSVTIDRGRALIGAPAGGGGFRFGGGRRRGDDGGDGATGAVYAFERDAAGNWNQQAKLTPNGLQPRSGYGRTLALNGSDAFIGAPAANGAVGTVFAFTYDAATHEWTDDARLSPFDGQVRSQFGSSIAFTGSEVWVGAPGAGGAGRVYRFRRDMSSGDWMGSIKLASRQVEGRDQFSGTLAIGDGIAVAGAPGDDFGAGTAIVFEQDAGGATWSEQGKVFSEIKNFEAAVGSQIDCTEGSAHAFDCNEVDLIAFLPTHTICGERGVRTNDVWGWTDAMTGKEYALVGMSNTASFVDISDPLNPIYLGKLPLHEGARPSTWRDIKVYKDHAFIVSDGSGRHGMQVFDLTQLRDVRDAPVVFEETAHYDGIASAHNIVINEETGYAYSVGSSGGGETCGGGLHMINIEDPKNPQFAGCFADPGTGRRNTGYSHDAQCVTYRGPDREHQGKEICLGANET